MASIAIEKIRKDDFSYRHLIEQEIRSIISPIVQEYRSKVEDEARRRLDATFDSTVGMIVHRTVECVLGEVRQKLDEAFRKAGR